MKISVCATWNSIRAILAIGLFLFGCSTAQSQTNTTPWSFVSSPDWFNHDIADLSGSTAGVMKAPGWDGNASNGINGINPEMVQLYDDVVTEMASYNPQAIVIAGDLLNGRWFNDETLDMFAPDTRVRATAINNAADIYYSWNKQLFSTNGINIVLGAIGDHEIGDDDWPEGSEKALHVNTMKQAFSRNMVDPLGLPGQISGVPSRPIGTGYEHGSYAYKQNNVLFVTVDVWRQNDPATVINEHYRSVSPDITDAVLVWLDDILDAADADVTIDHVIVQGHTPVLRPVRMQLTSGTLLLNREDSGFWQILRQHDHKNGGKVRFYFSGEVHTITATKDLQSDIIQLVHGNPPIAIGPALDVPGITHGNFAVLTVHPDRIEVDMRRFELQSDGSSIYWQASNPTTPGPSSVSPSQSVGTLAIDVSGIDTIYQTSGWLEFVDYTGLVINFDFDQSTASGNYSNSGSIGNTYYEGQKTGNVAVSPGMFGNGILLDGSTGFVESGRGNITDGESRTVTGWIKTGSGGTRTILSYGSDKAAINGRFEFRLNNGRPELKISNSIICQSDNAPAINNGAWHHVAIVLLDGHNNTCGDVLYYIDGQQYVSATNNTSAIIDTVAWDNYRIGVNGSGVGDFFSGSIDDVSVWGASLTSAKVRALANVGTHPDLQYDTLTMNVLFDLFNTRQGIANVSTSEWQYATGLTGSGGDILALDGNIAIQLDDLGNGVVSDIAAPAAYQQDGGVDGVVSMEAENAHVNTAQGSHSWVPVNSGTYSGAAALQALPNNGTNLNTEYVANSPRLDYQVNFAHTGTHYVWVRGVGATGNDDSLHVGLDGAAVTTADRITGLGPAVGWTQDTMDVVVATIEVATPGEHTLNVWMREDGTVVDKVVLSVNPAYQPSGTGPDESPIAAGTILFEDDFSDGDMVGWTVVDNCPFSQPEWSVQANVLMQTNNCFGFSPEGIALGTYQLSASTLPNDIDIRVQLRSEDPLLDPVTSNDASNLKYGTIGMIFGYQDANNYYRFQMNARNGHRKLWRVQAGTFTELVTSPQSYVGGQWINLRIIHQNGIILIFIDGTQVLAADDATYSSGKIAFFCAVNPSCSFDNVTVTAAPNDPMPGLNLPDSSSPAHASGEYFVTPGNTLDVAGMTTVASGIGGMEFVLDEGTGGEVSRTDFIPPYSSQFSALVPGDHAITAYLLDTSAVRLTSGTASVNMPRVGAGGIHLFAMGDSITFGLLDDIAADDISIDNRNTGGGYAPVLNDYLNAYNGGSPVTVINDGNSGELTSTGAGRIGMVLARTPAVQAYLFGYGTNDSGGSMPLMSGLGMSPGDADYAGSYKDYLQQIIDAVVLPPPTGAGKLVFFAKIPPYLSNSTRDAKIQEYNQVIDELVAQLKDTYPSSYLNYTPPDFHSYFTANQVEMASDLIHPNGTGYQSMGRLWCEALNGLQGWFCLDDDKDGLLNSLEAQLGTDPFLVDTDGDGLVDGNDGFVPIGSIPWGVDTNGDGFADGEQVFATDPLLADSDGDRLDDGLEVANASDPLDANSWPALADGDIAPLGAPDGQINAGDILVGTRIVLGLETATALELAHGDLYPPGAPDGMINLQDLILLRKMP